LEALYAHYDYVDPYSINVSTIPENKIEKFLVIWQWDDASWIMCSVFMTMTMQTGFALLESGCASLKNETNIMMKNAVDVLLGGLSYWAVGYGLSYGENSWSSAFLGFGDFFVHADGMQMGPTYATFFFQLSFASLSTTIVSGAIAERTNFYAYCVFSFFNTFVYCLPAGWLWAPKGFLKMMDVVDTAGSSVCVIGGFGALVAAKMIGPRLGRWEIEGDPPMGSATNAIIGTMMLWWAWIAFNSGATFGISGIKWILAIKATVTTLMSSFAGGTMGFIISMVTKKGKSDVMIVMNGIISALVSMMAGCGNVTILESIIIGGLGALIVHLASSLIKRLGIDDPVSASCVHGVGGLWGMLAVGIFAKRDNLTGYTKYDGLIHGGGFYLIGVQTLAVVVCITWSVISTFIIIILIGLCMNFRMKEHEELIGADYIEHNIHRHGNNITRTVSVFAKNHGDVVLGHVPVGKNKGHIDYLENRYASMSQTLRFRKHPSQKIQSGLDEIWSTDGQGELHKEMVDKLNMEQYM